MENSGQFKKGNRINPRGRPPGRGPHQIVLWDLKQAARSHCEEALQIIAKCMHDDDPRVRVMACNIMLERGYGKPEVKADVTMQHKFAVVPQVMEQSEWLRNKGQPVLDLKQVFDIKPDDDPDKGKLN